VAFAHIFKYFALHIEHSSGETTAIPFYLHKYHSFDAIWPYGNKIPFLKPGAL